MAELRHGDLEGAPHDVLDPRDLKYCCHRCSAYWSPEHDPFLWRNRLPFARWGLAEMQIMGFPLVAAGVALICLPNPFPWFALLPVGLLGLLLYFFRDPPRNVPRAEGTILAPADGKVVEITDLDHEPFVGEASVRIGIFLSIFNVHLNRAPIGARIIQLAYHPGRFVSATRPESALVNESMWIGFESEEPPHRRGVVRQISGLIARRIVCALTPGQVVEQGERLGMIKLGSRTELIVPSEDLTLQVRVGDKIKAGETVLGVYQ